MKRSFARRWNAWKCGWLALGVFWVLQPGLGLEAADDPKGDPAAETTATESTETAPPPVEAPPPPPETIPLEEITVQSQDALQQIRELEPPEKKPELLTSIVEQLPETSRSLDQIDQEIQSITKSGRVGRRIRRIEDEMSIVTKQLDSWQESLVTEIREIQDRLAKLDQTEILWKSTADSIAEEKGAESLNESIGAVLDAATKTRGSLTLSLIHI